MKSRSIHSPFISTSIHLADNSRLREPQQQAHAAVQSHFQQSSEPALVQIPVGCGKTGLISLLPFGLCRRRALIVAPNVTIREALFRAVDSASFECFWRTMRVAPGSQAGPFSARIDGPDSNLSDLIGSHFIVTNIQQLATSTNRWLPQFPPDFFDLLIFDEGHHNPANSWRRLMAHFPQARIVSLTATPFRADGQAVIGTPVYRYPFLRAMKRGYIKCLRSVQVAPSELSFTLRDSPRRCSLEEVLKLSEEDWFSRGVALSENCNKSLVATSLRECVKLRTETGQRLQIIAVTCSVDHAQQVSALYRRAGFRAADIHSLLAPSERRRILAELKSGLLDVIVQVQMLGEGFDHPPLSVAAIFRPFRSLSPYVQFVGRVMRVVPGCSNGNQGVIVSHVGLNVHRHWTQFQELDEADQHLWSGLISGESNHQPGVERVERQDGPAQPRAFHPEMLVEWERFDQPIEVPVHSSQRISSPFPERTSPHAIRHELPALAGPQELRRQAKSQLSQRVDEAIRQTLGRARISPQGWNIGRQLPSLRRFNNWTATRVWIYRELNIALERTPASKRSWSLEETEAAIAAVDRIQGLIDQMLTTRLGRK